MGTLDWIWLIWPMMGYVKIGWEKLEGKVKR